MSEFGNSIGATLALRCDSIHYENIKGHHSKIKELKETSHIVAKIITHLNKQNKGKGPYYDVTKFEKELYQLHAKHDILPDNYCPSFSLDSNHFDPENTMRALEYLEGRKKIPVEEKTPQEIQAETKLNLDLATALLNIVKMSQKERDDLSDRHPGLFDLITKK